MWTFTSFSLLGMSDWWIWWKQCERRYPSSRTTSVKWFMHKLGDGSITNTFKRVMYSCECSHQNKMSTGFACIQILLKSENFRMWIVRSFSILDMSRGWILWTKNWSKFEVYGDVRQNISYISISSSVIRDEFVSQSFSSLPQSTIEIFRTASF